LRLDISVVLVIDFQCEVSSVSFDVVEYSNQYLSAFLNCGQLTDAVFAVVPVSVVVICAADVVLMCTVGESFTSEIVGIPLFCVSATTLK